MLHKIGPAFEVGQIVDYLPVGELVSVPMPKRWYIRRTAPNREFRIMKRCGQLGLSAYLPTLTSRREFHKRQSCYEWIERRNVVAPLITGCILVPDFEVDAENWKYVDGIFGWLRFGDYVPSLTPQMMTDIRHIEAIGNTPKSKRAHDFAIDARRELMKLTTLVEETAHSEYNRYRPITVHMYIIAIRRRSIMMSIA